MKNNIHILPTDKPSRLFIDIDNDKLTITNYPIDGKHFMNQHIYITSNEEIKKGDWCIDDIEDVFKIEGLEYFKKFCKKIILTTDQDLIKDGVQAIDDEFLEWFVKNPSFEEVKIERKSHIEIEEIIYEGDYQDVEYIDYKIIIPKEEPKQETVEEAGVIAAGLCEHLEAREQAFFIAGFQECIKWQSERMYSEEDIREAYFSGVRITGEGWNGEYAEGNNPNIEDNFSEGFKQWFEQFKNK